MIFYKRKFNRFIKNLAEDIVKSDASSIDFAFSNIAKKSRIQANYLASWLTPLFLIVVFSFRKKRYEFRIDPDGKYHVKEKPQQGNSHD